LKRLGALGILVPEQHGGLGLGYSEMGVVLEEAGRALLPGPFFSSGFAAVAAIRASGDEAAQAEYLPGIATGSRVATLALLEPGRDDWGAPATRASRRAGEWRLTWTKIAPDGAASDLLLFSAMADGELGLFALDAKEARVTPLVTVDGSRKLAEVSLSDARARRLGAGSATAALSGVVDRLRIGWVADAVGAADRALELATEYAKVRRQFDRPIGAFQAVQHLLADMLRNVELARASVAEALRVADDGDPTALHRAATLTAAFASDALYRVTADAIQVLGGIGFTWEHDAHLYYKRAWSMRASVGAAADLKEEFARLMLEAQPSTTRLAL
jgi:alkylation response protein AidB-like acyl-CoA dehydrogenase